MFEALMPILVLDELRLAPQTLGRNDEVHAVIQRRYALEELGYPVWGLSPSATPGTGAYAEYGARPLGLRGYPSGVVAPYASALALAVTPQEAEANLRQLADSLHAYGEYGFYDAVDPRTGRVAYAYLALDQSMLFLALANHLGDGCVRKRFAQDPVVQRALPGDGGSWNKTRRQRRMGSVRVESGDRRSIRGYASARSQLRSGWQPWLRRTVGQETASAAGRTAASQKPLDRDGGGPARRQERNVAMVFQDTRALSLSARKPRVPAQDATASPR
jgi:hypothetical protein